MVSDADKKKRVFEIEDEVIELHPILKHLFKNMPMIDRVEYTHGTNEMGADFLLHSKNSLFGKMDYIAVIVKTKPIKQDYSDIKRQIEECMLPKLINNGKQKIYVTEIWVITNKNVTNNARDKINFEFKDKKIQITDGDLLVSWIDDFLPEFWGAKDVALSSYFLKVKESIIYTDKNTNIMPLKDYYYIDQDVDLIKGYGELSYISPRKRKKVSLIDDVKTTKISILEGGVGIGKSKLLRHIALHYSTEKIFSSTGIIPCYINYKMVASKFNSSIFDIISDEVKSFATEKTTFLLLIDGVDEIRVSDQETDAELKKFISAIMDTPGVNAIFAMRYSPIESLSDSAFKCVQCYSVKPLRFSQIINYLVNTCSNLSIEGRFIEDLKKSSLFREIPKSPIAALLLAKIMTENSMQDLPANMTELYSKYTEIMLGRWDFGAGLKTQVEYVAVSTFIMNLAQHFISNNIFSISYDDALVLFKGYLSERNLSTAINAKMLLDYVLDNSGIIVFDKYQNDVTFKHRTFLEFFIAKFHKEHSPLVIDDRALRRFWSNIYYFYIGLHKDCPEIIQQVSEITPHDEETRWGRLFFLGSYYLAAFMTPYKFVERYLPGIILDSAKLYDDICESKIPSVFSDIPRLPLLFVIQYFVRMNYSFEYFSKALDSVCVTIDDMDVDDNIKITALFVLSVVGIDLKNKTPLEFLINKYCHKLPLDISLALDIEKKESQLSDECLVKNSKRIKSMQRSPTFKAAVEKISKRPISFEK